MNNTSNGTIVVIIMVVLLLGVGLYFFMQTGTETIITPPPAAVVTPPVVTPTPPPATNTATTTAPATSTPFVLSAAQKQALIKFGISSSSIPKTISVAQEACFVAKLGVPRVVEIKAGAVPTTAEFMKVQSCI